jgi:uncharacterized protein YqjF (DUF2071 family)
MSASAPRRPEPVSPDAPVLRGPVLMNQDWRDLTYLHWAVAPGRVAPLLPRGVHPDVLDGVTYVGLVPFRMVDAGIGRRSTAPWLGTFLETNVRLYSVDERGRRGVVFLSLDADRLVVVLAARLGFRVPYRWSRMSYDAGPDGLHTYRSTLRWPGITSSSTIAVRAGGRREPSELDDFVSARWRLHTSVLGRAVHVPNNHGRWPLHDAEVVELDDDGLLAGAGFADLAGRAPDHTAYSPGVHTVFGLPRPV